MDKKELIAKYKERPITGGVFRITNTKNGKYLLGSGIDMKGSKNLFDFSVSTNSCFHLKLKKDWDLYEAKAFEFDVLDEIEKEPDQETKSFAEDLKILEQMWRERLGGEEY
ncbi:GIY-YIG nuclease family protein [Tepidanaerobacter acetatoxydans]|uniref:GIY-YIG nuclease family protein n=1 Tax=Tepidanaerobacter acetatoxydans TaxID=499229 RepID=UPI001BD25323|nr:GIY-YIG nuclease family protein [Tepidanaerobacter acetatoxydans]